MSMTGQKLLGVAAVAIGVVGLVGMGIHEVARSCDEKTEVVVASADAKASIASKATSGSCPASKSTKHASIYAMLAGADGSSSCAAKKSAKSASYATADAKKAGGECNPADCESKQTASAVFASASASGASEYACSSEKKSSVSTASAEESSCGSTKKASAALVSSDGGSSSCATRAKSAEYAKADGSSCSMSACSEFEACSVNAGDLAFAKGDKLKFYEKERAQDGVALADVKLPEFSAVDLAGNEVSSSDLIGQPTVLVMLASHCGHSYKTLPILEQARADYESKGLRVVGLMVGTSTESASKWIDTDKYAYDVWVTPDASVADALKSHLVPTYVLIDAEGNVKAKLIGFKEEKEVNENIPALLVQADGAQKSVDS
jgi:thiol-disulfide isomerase/thioredoxin